MIPDSEGFLILGGGGFLILDSGGFLIPGGGDFKFLILGSGVGGCHGVFGVCL